MRSLFRHLRVLLTTLPLVSCVAFVDTFDVAEHCQIEGAGACADCLRTSCTPQIDACCGSEACAKANVVATSILDVLDACGKNAAGTCASGLAVTRAGGEEEQLRQCALGACKDACTQGSGSSTPGLDDARWTCDLPRTDTTACAQCMYTSCGDELDECCVDSSCENDSSLSEDLGACFTGDQGACSYVLRDGSKDGTSGIVRACLVDKCPSCYGDGIAHRECTPRASGDYCTCTSSKEAKGPECSAAKIGVDYCVAYQGGCTCGAYHVTSANRDQCTASFSAGASSHEPDGGCVPRPDSSYDTWRCCLSVDSSGPRCTCEDYPLASCGSSATQLDDCNEDTLRGLLTTVTTCSR